jgi:hypothetical protein
MAALSDICPMRAGFGPPTFWFSMKARITSSPFCRGAVLSMAAAFALACSSDAKKNTDACTPDDADGVISEPAALLLTVTDGGFMPKILSAQNTSEITLSLENLGTLPHSFVVDCKPTPNSDGCPPQSCFPSESTLGPLAPGEKVTVVFESPLVEGIYKFHSDVPEDSELTPGQFIIQ